MKKVLALILCAVMLLASIPVMSFAAETTIKENEKLIIKNGETYTVKSGDTLYVANKGALIVEEGGKLVVNGDIITYSGSDVYIEGTLVGAKNISGSGDVVVQVRFDQLSKYVTTDGAVTVSYAFADTVSGDVNKEIPYEALDASKEDAVYVPLNSYLFVKAEIGKEEEATLGHNKYDDSLFNVYMNGAVVTFGDGNHYVQLTTAADITYDTWKGYNNYLTTFPVYLPSGEGYTVYNKTGEKDTVKVKYGTPISFYVEIDEDYDMSQYEVYIYNGYGWTGLDTSTLLGKLDPAQPDEYGYYHIPAVVGDTTVYVVGVMENETITMLGDVMTMIKNIFEMFASLFAEFFAMLGFGTATTVA
ncbi:MAG: hypothetical protein IKJ88_01450 [Clostridia bacterium]|nr:hypothetical protein [Clostridia bacterium]